MFEIGTATNYQDLLSKLHTFLTATGSAYGLTYTGTGTGVMINYKGGASSVAETFTVTATSATNFTVVGSVSGSIGPATVGSTFTHAKLTFRINAGGTAFIAGDVFLLNTAPKWTAMRAYPAYIATIGGSMNNTSWPAVNAFDDVVSSTSQAANAATSGNLYIQLNTAREVLSVQISGPNNTSEAPKNFTIEHSDDGSAWTVDSTQTNIMWTALEVKTYTLTAPGAHTYWRLNVSLNNDSGSWTSISELKFIDGATGFPLTRGEYIWKAPGNDGNSEIYVGVRAFNEPGADYHNWRMGGFTGYTSANTFYNQPGAVTRPVVPLWNSSIPYWFVANGRCVKVVAKISTVYTCCYLGFIEAYMSPNQFPYPLAVGGSMTWYSTEPTPISTNWKWSYSGYEHTAYPMANTGSQSQDDNNSYQLRLRRPDGVWRGYLAKHSTSTQYYQTTYGIIWPYANEMTALRENLDGSYPLFPIVLQDRGTSVNTWGRLDGVFATTGYSIGAESTVDVGQIQHVIFPNIYRTDTNNFYALRLD